MQKPYAPKYGQGKTKIDLFRDFFTKITHVQVVNFIPVKVSTLYTLYVTIMYSNFKKTMLGHDNLTDFILYI
jgi:hypothetical protein